MRAGNSISLKPGFHVQAGSEFSAKIENIDDCGSSKGLSQKILIQSVPEEQDHEDEFANNKVFDFSYTVYPNPSNEFINIL